MSPETQLILSRIDAQERAFNLRLEDLIAATARTEEKVDVAARDALAGRLLAEEANIKVGRVHEAQKRTAGTLSTLEVTVAKLMAVESALTRYAGPALRTRVILVFIAGVATLEWLLHLLAAKLLTT